MGFHWAQVLANMLIKQLEISPTAQHKLVCPDSLGKTPIWNDYLFFPDWAPSETIPLKILRNITGINKSSSSVAMSFFFFCVYLASVSTLALAKFEV